MVIYLNIVGGLKHSQNFILTHCLKLLGAISEQGHRCYWIILLKIWCSRCHKLYVLIRETNEEEDADCGRVIDHTV